MLALTGRETQCAVYCAGIGEQFNLNVITSGIGRENGPLYIFVLETLDYFYRQPYYRHNLVSFARGSASEILTAKIALASFISPRTRSAHGLTITGQVNALFGLFKRSHVPCPAS
jgi:hypothetical protein